MQPSIGRIIIYTFPAGMRAGRTERPAIIVQAWNQIDHASPHQNGLVNAAVFLDGSNDEGLPTHAYSVGYDAAGKHGTWRWPERV